MVVKRYLFPVLLLIMTSLNAEENIPQIKAGVNPQETTVGVPVEYRVSISSKNKKIKILLPEEKIYFPPVKEDKKDKAADKNDDASNENFKNVPLYIIESVNKQDNSDANLLYQTIVMKVVYYRTGKHNLPLIEFVDQDGISLGYKIPQINVTALNKEGKLAEIEPPLNLSGNYTRLILLIAGCILGGGLLFLLIYFIRRRVKQAREKVIILPPKTIFKQEIAEFKKADYLNKNDIESFVFGLSHIFRKFLANSLKFDAVEMTNEEIYAEIDKYFSGEEKLNRKTEMRRLMDLWDLSKFAEFTPAKEVLVSNLQDTENFVLKKSWGGGNEEV